MNSLRSSLLILVRGANDIGSAVAHRLFTSGYAVVLHEISQPATARRRMSFTDAVFDEHARLDGVEARLITEIDLMHKLLSTRMLIPVVTQNLQECLINLHPDVLVDARMRKHSEPEVQRGLAKLTIGLGPNFKAGETTDLAIETSWGENLGQIVEQGETSPLQGEPREIEGHARDRYVYAPVAGIFHTQLEIGDTVKAGQTVAFIGSQSLLAPIAGALRGLTRNGIPVDPNTKVIEVDPRTQSPQVSGIGERPARIADAVLTAIQRWEKGHAH